MGSRGQRSPRPRRVIFPSNNISITPIRPSPVAPIAPMVRNDGQEVERISATQRSEGEIGASMTPTMSYIEALDTAFTKFEGGTLKIGGTE